MTEEEFEAGRASRSKPVYFASNLSDDALESLKEPGEIMAGTGRCGSRIAIGGESEDLGDGWAACLEPEGHPGPHKNGTRTWYDR